MVITPLKGNMLQLKEYHQLIALHINTGLADG
jgi:hypothetical protein